MAVDSQLKRQSATCMLLFSMLSGVYPSGLTVSMAERFAVSACYAQNFNAIGIMAKPNISVGKPDITATATQPNITAEVARPSITVTSKGA